GARRGADGGVGRQRLARVDIERRAGDRPGLERGRERGQVNNFAARAVHDDGGPFHLRERLGIDEVARLLGERRVQRDEVRATQQLVELHQLRARGARAATMFPSGAFTTYTPRAVAAGTSMLSTPTPARPTTARRGAASRIFAVTFVSLRTISASTSARRDARSASERPVVVRTSQRSRRSTRPSSARGSAT